MQKIKKMLSNRIGKNIVMIAGGTAFAQVINAMLSPIISRIYSPEEYGVLTVYVAILGLMAVIASLSYENSIPIAEDDEQAINSLVLGIIILVIIFVFTSLILYLFGDKLLPVLKAKILSNFKYYIPFGILFTGLYQIFMQWAYRKKDYKGITKTKYSQSIAQNSTMIGLGALGFGPVGLIIGRILGESAGITSLASNLFKKERLLLSSYSLKQIKHNFFRYKNFPLYSTPNQLLIVAGIQLPVIFISQLYGLQVIGFYGLANSIVNLPMTLIGNSVRDVFFSEAASIGKENPMGIKVLTNKLLKKLIIVGSIPSATLLIFGPLLFSFVFGDVWIESGNYARLISIMIYSKLIFSPISGVFIIFERLKESFIISFFRLVMVLITFLLAKMLHLNPYWTIGIYSIVISFVYLLYYIVAQRIINEQIEKSEFC